jgi:hypothetical protein
MIVYDLVEKGPDAARELWGALLRGMESNEDGPEKLLQLALDVRGGLIKLDEVIRTLCGCHLEDLIEEALEGESPTLVTDHLD